MIEDSHFDDEPVPLEEEKTINDIIEEVKKEEEKSQELKSDFNEVDMSVLDSEFNLELLFDEDPDEQVVAEIEDLISEDDSGAVLDSLVQEVSDDESEID